MPVVRRSDRTRNVRAPGIVRWQGSHASSAPPPAFSPSDLTPILWLDASDSATITLNGATVSQWNDKSSSGFNFVQGAAGNQPTYSTAAVNGLNAVTFDGSNDVMSNANWASVKPVSLWAVIKFTSVSVLQGVLVGAGAQHHDWALLGTAFMRFNSYDTAGIATSNQTLTAGALATIGLTYSAGSVWTCYTNGTATGTGTAAATFGASLTAYLGARTAGAASPFGGVLCELVATNSALTAGNITSLTSYAQTKWGAP